MFSIRPTTFPWTWNLSFTINNMRIASFSKVLHSCYLSYSGPHQSRCEFRSAGWMEQGGPRRLCLPGAYRRNAGIPCGPLFPARRQLHDPCDRSSAEAGRESAWSVCGAWRKDNVYCSTHAKHRWEGDTMPMCQFVFKVINPFLMKMGPVRIHECTVKPKLSSNFETRSAIWIPFRFYIDLFWTHTCQLRSGKPIVLGLMTVNIQVILLELKVFKLISIIEILYFAEVFCNEKLVSDLISKFSVNCRLMRTTL